MSPTCPRHINYLIIPVLGQTLPSQRHNTNMAQAAQSSGLLSLKGLPTQSQCLAVKSSVSNNVPQEGNQKTYWQYIIPTFIDPTLVPNTKRATT